MIHRRVAAKFVARIAFFSIHFIAFEPGVMKRINIRRHFNLRHNDRFVASKPDSLHGGCPCCNETNPASARTRDKEGLRKVKPV